MKYKNIVMLSHIFPPHAHVGGRRAYFFAKYLSKMNYNVIIITSNQIPKKQWEWDVDMSKFEIYRTNYKQLRFWQNLCSTLSNAKIPFISRNFTRLGRLLFAQDYNYTIDISSAINKLSNVDLIIATGGPWYIFEEAAKLKEKLGCRLVLDYRDVWNALNKEVGIDSLNNFGSSFYGKLIEKKYLNKEKKCLGNADYVIAVSSAIKQNISSISSSTPIEVVYNGFDEEEIKNKKVSQSDKFIIFYGGQLRVEQNVKKICQALDIIKIKSILTYNNIEFQFLGSLISHQEAIKDLLNYGEKIRVTDFIQKDQFLELYQTANILLQLSYQDKKGIMSSKLLQYIGVRTPILLVSNTEDCMEKIVRETNSGFICKTPQEIADTIIKCYSYWQKGERIPFHPNHDEIEKYSFENQTKNLISFIENDI